MYGRSMGIGVAWLGNWGYLWIHRNSTGFNRLSVGLIGIVSYMCNLGNTRLTNLGHKFGKVPFLTTHLYKNDGWQNWGISRKGKLCMCTGMISPSQGGIDRIATLEGPIAYLMFAQFLQTNDPPLHVSYCLRYCGGSYSISSICWGWGIRPNREIQ